MTRNTQYKTQDNHESGYRKLIAWQVAHELARYVYQISDKFPNHELYGLTSQTRKAVLSVPLNIVEGFARNNKNEFRNFLRISLGSLAEVEYLLEFAKHRKYVTITEFEKASELKDRSGQLLWKLMKSQS